MYTNALATVNQSVVNIKVPFTYFPVGTPIAFEVKLFADLAGTTLVKGSLKSTNVNSTGASGQLSTTTTIDLSAVPIGDYFQGIVAYINNIAQPLVMLAGTKDIVVSGIVIGDPIWG